MPNFSKILFIVILIILAGGVVFLWLQQPPKEKSSDKLLTNNLLLTNKNMKITSPAFGEGQKIPAKYTCDGEGINPSLAIAEIPSNAQSLVLIVDDPDAPSGDFVHWLVWDISPTTTIISEDNVPNGAIQGRNSASQSVYYPPCPPASPAGRPSGVHHYYFKIYALDTKLGLAGLAKKKELLSAMEGHILDWTELVGIYQRG